MIVDTTHSHIDGRDLLGELHPRKTLDIKRRVDGRETWHEGDWLSDLKREIDRAKAYLFSRDKQFHREAADSPISERPSPDTDNRLADQIDQARQMMKEQGQ